LFTVERKAMGETRGTASSPLAPREWLRLSKISMDSARRFAAYAAVGPSRRAPMVALRGLLSRGIGGALSSFVPGLAGRSCRARTDVALSFCNPVQGFGAASAGLTNRASSREGRSAA